MSFQTDLAALFQRDLDKVIAEIRGFSQEADLWRAAPGMINPAGNLVLHLEGNLREYVGRQLGGVAYQRQRPLEFSNTGVSAAELIARIEAVRELVPPIAGTLSEEALEARYPEDVMGGPMVTRWFLIHLHGHLMFHLGQINATRRVLA